jgi:hypothetical protein
MNMSILIKSLNDMCIFELINFIKIISLNIYQIEYPIKLNKNWSP